MTLSFENDNDVIVYALEKIILFARRFQHIFAAQCVWWIASIIGVEPELVKHIDKLHGRTIVEEPWNPEEVPSKKATIIQATSTS